LAIAYAIDRTRNLNPTQSPDGSREGVDRRLKRKSVFPGRIPSSGAILLRLLARHLLTNREIALPTRNIDPMTLARDESAE
jgi:hypothetical protein